MARNTSGRESDSKLIALVKNALGLKANTADLATVATTGSYNDLSGKPTIPAVPQMATQVDMSDWTSGKTVDAAVLKADFQSALQALDTVGDAVDHHASEISSLQSGKADKSEIPTAVSELTNDSGFQTASDVQTAISSVRQLPAVTASDNDKFLRVVSGAWAAATVPSAESNSFGGGTT